MRDKGKTTHCKLNMKQLIADINSRKFELQLPAHYLNSKSTGQMIIPATYDEKLEDQLVEFFMTYLNASIPKETIADRYGAKPEEVLAIRDSWHTALARYYI